jgi:hypothetical protein
MRIHVRNRPIENDRKQRNGSQHRFRPQVERLPDRILPALCEWIGIGNENFENPNNWVGGVPGANDTAFFGPESLNCSLNTNHSVSLLVLNSGFTGTLSLNGHVLMTDRLLMDGGKIDGRALNPPIDNGQLSVGTFNAPNEDCRLDGGEIVHVHLFMFDGPGDKQWTSTILRDSLVDSSVHGLLFSPPEGSSVLIENSTINNVDSMIFNSGSIRLKNSTLNNTGSFYMSGLARQIARDGGAPGLINNLGTFFFNEVPPAWGNPNPGMVYTDFYNFATGTVEVMNGTLHFKGDGHYAGRFDLKQTTSIVKLTSILFVADYKMYDGFETVGPGQLVLGSDEHLELDNGAEVRVSWFTMEDDTQFLLKGLFGANLFEWKGGKIEGPGRLWVKAADHMIITGNPRISDHQIDAVLLDVNGQVDWNGGRILMVRSAQIWVGGTAASLIINGGTRLLKDENTFNLAALVVFPGALVQNLGTNPVIVKPILLNLGGVIDLGGPGQVQLQGGFQQAAGLTTLSEGSLEVTDTFQVDGGEVLVDNSTVIITGDVQQTGGEILLTGLDTSVAVVGLLGVVAGSVTLQGGSIDAEGGMEIQASGVVRAWGVVNGSVVNHGSLSIGDADPSVARGLVVNGDYMQTGCLNADLFAPNLADHLQVTGLAELGGALHVGLATGYVPQIGDDFTLVNFESMVSPFAEVHLPFLPWSFWGIEYSVLLGTLTLTVEPL